MLLNISRCTGGSPAAWYYSNGAKVEERQWLLYKSKAHIDFHFLRGSDGLGQEGTTKTEAASHHPRQKEPKPQA